MEMMNTNVPFGQQPNQGQQAPHNRPHPSRTISNSSSKSQNAKINKDIEQKTKRTRSSRRPPRFRKKTKDTVDNVPYMVSSVLSSTQNPLMPCTPSNPSTSNSIASGISGSKHDRKSITNHQIETKFVFTIEPVTSHKAGQFIRRRNLRYKYVNLKSFANSVDRLPCLFITKLASIRNLTSNFRKLSVNNQKDMTKSDLNQYPQVLPQNEPSTSSKGRKRKKKEKSKDLVEEATFSNYINQDEVTVGLANGELIKGIVRINPKNFRDSYVSNEDTSQTDYYLTSVVDRNRALDGDEVILRLRPEEEWIDGKKTATVVFITQQVHTRTAVGSLKPMLKRNSAFAVFYPRDKRIPVIRIPSVHWPNGFKKNPKLFEKILFVAQILDWTTPNYALGTLTENLGMSGNLKVEAMSILREFNLDVTPYGPEVAQYLPQSYTIPPKELEYREDIRKECVFTIDPATAKDLDDAVSVKELPNGNYEVGVHISDASFYLEGGTELDQKVSKKATTIYLVDRVYHMLPVELCMFCSLLPGQDKLSFSVFWEMTEEGDVINKRFARTVMNSCTQMAYEHAQMIIENPEKDFQAADFPAIHNDFSVTDLKKTVTVLQKIAVKLRERRVQNGALKIDQVKLLFDLDPVNGEPTRFCVYENKESHRLIEEFMLLANIAVAERISEMYPDIAFLRCHEPPKQTMLVELQNSLSTYGIHIDISSSGGINASLSKYITDDFPGKCRAAVLNHIMAKAMTRARYFCPSAMEALEYKHYALSVPIYTHFTSPIRRYADIMVHRLLAASLDYHEKPEWDKDYVSAIAANCNAQKYNAKRAGEVSGDLYLAHYIEKREPVRQDCVVVDVKEKSFDAIVLNTGSIVRIYQNNCLEDISWSTEVIATVKANDSEETENSKKAKGEHEKKLLKLRITFPKMRDVPETPPLVVEMFTMVQVLLTRKPNSYKLDATLVRPVATDAATRK